MTTPTAERSPIIEPALAAVVADLQHERPAEQPEATVVEVRKADEPLEIPHGISGGGVDRAPDEFLHHENESIDLERFPEGELLVGEVVGSSEGPGTFESGSVLGEVVEGDAIEITGELTSGIADTAGTVAEVAGDAVDAAGGFTGLAE